VVAGPKVTNGRIDPELSRELFIRHALVDGDWDTRHRFFHSNRELLDEIAGLEDRARRRDLLVDDEALFAFYDERIPADVVSGRHFDSWWKKASRRTPDLLSLTAEVVIDDDADRVDQADYPDEWSVDGFRLPVSYQFEPGAEADGVTVHVPLDILNQLTPEPFGWQIPGLRADLATAMVRALPKRLRRQLVPAPDRAEQALAELPAQDGSFAAALTAVLSRQAGVVVTPADIDPQRIPPHLQVTFRVEDKRGRPLAEGKDLLSLQQQLTGKLRSRLADLGRGVEQAGLTAWTFERLPERVAATGARGAAVAGYPALVDEQTSVAVRVLESPERAEQATWAGQRRLLILSMPTGTVARRTVLSSLGNRAKLALANSPYRHAGDLFDDAVLATVDALMHVHGAPVSDRAGFEELLQRIRADFVPSLTETLTDTARALAIAHELRERLAPTGSRLTEPSLADMRRQLDELVAPGFIAALGRGPLHECVRYLDGIRHRLDKLPAAPGRDLVKLERVHELEHEYRALAERARAHADPPPPQLGHVRWMLEELRVSEFAQNLRTAEPVSPKRIRRELAAAAASLGTRRG